MKRLSNVVLIILLSWLAAAHTPPQIAAAQTPVEYVVKPGDTLLAIALQFGTSAAAIQTTNDLKNPNVLQVGQTLRIPGGSAPASGVTHIVQPGDTLLAIAMKYGVNVGDLTRANGIAESALLQIGQKLTIPGTASVPASAPVQQSAAPVVELIPLVPTISDGEVEAIRAQLLDLHNQQRIAAGLQPLAYSPMLQTSAQGQADDCAGRGSCSHFGSDGSRSSQRIARAGFTGRITGENWAWARTAVRAFDMWYTREIPDGPHLLNIMSPRYAEVGFGIAASKGGYYMIANFGAP
jgi:LysM repeat protein